MAQLTERENFLRLYKGECPEWVPTYSFGKLPGMMPQDLERLASSYVGPGVLNEKRTPTGGFDCWGVEFVATEGTGMASLPKPGQFILDDIRKWRDVIKAPDLSGVDWEAMAKKDLEMADIDQKNTATIFALNIGYFEELMAFMGFTEGLCALSEEPEECKELIMYMADFYVDVAEKCIDYYNVDVLNITDDTATKLSPFISPQTYRDIIKPAHAKQAEVARKRGIPIEMHCCGRCEDLIDDWIDFGVVAWNPAQTTNDLKAIKEKYGNSLAICGGWDFEGKVADPNIGEEEFKQTVRDAIDAYAPGGGYCWCAGALGAIGDPITDKKNKWMAEEVSDYGRSFYSKQKSTII
ncbi:Uroporphyrinogen decarboxylase (URO-D) [Acetitomaculum ruminis DSM 5522]|uniref:Uroporphyrinogen decarboxylase (URO-D) n=1 Tax=Acetitomaculum ruminis DSM 5522 TaxID=1120918 RepID=A0A1I0UXC9_9FIRM|nr:uroporphyrinogen decarboxylase family protein [Acetitomaculum ruminis]SFA68715.1 Uroporphyrinogen decarboxylase (URO-D) [Acetitomaculum ruminis DSM 5522]